ncbi:hypothetical protein N9219_01605 [bacterium]|nr:hypothetical protein [bacterium]
MTPINRLRNIVRNRRTFDTLGGKSKFTLENRSNRLIIINSSGNEYEVSEELAKAVSDRYESSPINNKYKASNYVDPVWQNCPNRIVSPYVARILKEET